MDFVSLLTKDLLDNTLTRKAPLPDASFNLQVLGAEVAVPNEDQDPKVPASERLSQDSLLCMSVLDPEVEEALDIWTGRGPLRKAYTA